MRVREQAFFFTTAVAPDRAGQGVDGGNWCRCRIILLRIIKQDFTLTESNRTHGKECNPIVVEVWRGGKVESRHRGAVAVVSHDGETLFSSGDIDIPVYPRSSLKPLQALALFESGAVSRLELDNSRVCLACASHNGENEHAQRVDAWLHDIGFDESSLECGSHYPYSDDARNALIRQGVEPGPLRNNCSGKHAGFLSVAKCLGVDPRGYIEPGHPVQQLVKQIVEQVCDVSLDDVEPAVDGCGIPVYGIPLRNLAKAFAAFSPRATNDRFADARRAIVAAIQEYPYLIAGSGRFCSRVTERSSGRVITKTGAEGVFTGVLLEEGIGIALKIDDGATRAAEVFMASMFARFCRDDAFRAALDDESSVVVRNAAGRAVGRVTAAAD
ncbi:MAG: asparaginase [Proteobacteria bacterium]|nr:MAG: asparaginase [Pseudomonadota bacterium]